MYPKEETKEDMEAREKHLKRSVNTKAVMILTLMPCAMLMGIGYEWGAMSPAMATMSVISACILCIGAITVACIRLDW